MLDFVPLTPELLAEAAAQAGADHLLDPPELARRLSAAPIAEAGLHDGRAVMAAGVLPQWPGRAIAWAAIGRVPTPAWTELTRRVGAALDRGHALGSRRIETTVRDDFAPGLKWMRLLGFRVETLMAAYGPDGSAHFLFSRIRPAQGQGAADPRPRIESGDESGDEAAA